MPNHETMLKRCDEMGTKIIKGCVVMMKSSSGLIGYGNPQCVQDVCEPLGTISLYGHNQHYKTHDVLNVIEYPIDDLPALIEAYRAARQKVLLLEMLSCSSQDQLDRAYKELESKKVEKTGPGRFRWMGRDNV